MRSNLLDSGVQGPKVRENYVRKIIFLRSYFLIYGPWTPDLLIFDLKFGFYVKFPPRNRLERSRIRNPGPKMRKFVFKYDFSQTSLDEGFQKNLAASEPNEENIPEFKKPNPGKRRFKKQKEE